MRIVQCILALLTLLGSYKYHVITLVDKVLLQSIDLPIAEMVGKCHVIRIMSYVLCSDFISEF